MVPSISLNCTETGELYAENASIPYNSTANLTVDRAQVSVTCAGVVDDLYASFRVSVTTPGVP